MFFSWYYFSMNVGSLLGEGGCPLMRQHVSFAATYATIMVSMVRSALLPFTNPPAQGGSSLGTLWFQILGVWVFLWGRHHYVRRDDGVPEPNRLTCQCVPAALLR